MVRSMAPSAICKHHLSHAIGRLPEWLGTGLQNRGQRFESATDLQKPPTLAAFNFLTVDS